MRCSAERISWQPTPLPQRSGAADSVCPVDQPYELVDEELVAGLLRRAA
jgi:hypothetical protein